MVGLDEWILRCFEWDLDLDGFFGVKAPGALSFSQLR